MTARPTTLKGLFHEASIWRGESGRTDSATLATSKGKDRYMSVTGGDISKVTINLKF